MSPGDPRGHGMDFGMQVPRVIPGMCSLLCVHSLDEAVGKIPCQSSNGRVVTVQTAVYPHSAEAGPWEMGDSLELVVNDSTWRLGDSRRDSHCIKEPPGLCGRTPVPVSQGACAYSTHPADIFPSVANDFLMFLLKKKNSFHNLRKPNKMNCIFFGSLISYK